MQSLIVGRIGTIIAVVVGTVASVRYASATDRMYVSSFTGNRIHRFSAATGAEGSAIGPGTGLVNPLGATIGPDGAMYVTSEGTDQVLRIHLDTGALLGVFVGDDPGTPLVDESGGLDNPAAAVFGPDGHLYVASFETDSILKYDGATGAFLGVFVAAGSGGLDGPDAGMAFGPGGDLFVPSFWSHSVLRYRGSDGASLGAFVPSGSGGLLNPRTVVFRPGDDHLLVSSEGGDEVLVFDGSDGAPLGTLVAGIDGPSGMAIGFDGNLYVASVNNGAVERYDPAGGAHLGHFVTGLAGPVYLFFGQDDSPDFTPQNQFGTGITLSVSWGDSDGDGDPDLAVARNGGPVANGLYINDGDGTFTTQSPFGPANAFALVWGDYDNDGDQDVAVATSGNSQNFLYVNNGNGTFTQQAQFGVSIGVGMAWGDFDNDGDLDMAVGNGIVGVAQPNALYVNNGNGTFTARAEFGAGQTDSVAWGDFDNDGDLDLAVGNGGFSGAEQNFLYVNNGDGTFTERAEFGTGDTAAVAWGDANNDGWLDLAVGNWETGRCYLYINNQDGTFTQSEQFGDRDTNTVAWGDFDNDGDLDLAVGNGDFTSADQNYLYINQSDGTFVESAQFGLGSTDGVAWADYDGDGDLDLAAGNEHSPPINQLYINQHNDNVYLSLHLVGHRHDLGAGYSNRDGIGARVWVYENGHLGDGAFLLGYRQIEAKSGFSSQNFVDAHFGLPGQNHVDIRIAWPGSAGQSIVQEVRGVPIGRRLTIHERACTPGLDCNANGIDDACDLAVNASTDCNGNGVPDECDVSGGGSLDCNGNNVPDECEPDCNQNNIADECDITAGTSEDCSSNGIPDECEPDCNGTGEADSCDILAGTSEDCSGNGIPDECEPDCNGNTFPDSCDIFGGASEDCNTNAVPDECDILAGTSQDVNGNGIPDECDPCVPPPAPQSGAGEVLKNRYLSFTVGGAAANRAVRVRFVSLPGPFAVWNGVDMWVGDPRAVSELSGRSDAAPPTTNMATLQCDPRFADWGPSGVVHVYHAGIVPGGRYAVQVLDDGCPPLEANFSAPLEVLIGRWGDAAAPFHSGTGMWPGPDGRIDITVDVVSLLEKFGNRPGAPSKPRADVEPAVPDQRINISDVTRVLDAFRGVGFPFLPSGPVPCAE